MQIISGLYKGQKLHSSREIRPTMGFIKQAIFNILLHNPHYSQILKNAYVLDLFCGTGALGLEALSNGAKHAFMIDKDINSITRNSSRYKEKVTILRANAYRLPRASKACDLIFIDPPYHQTNYEEILRNLIKSQWIRPGSIVIFEMSRQSKYNNLEQYKLLEERKYSTVKLLLLRFMPHNLESLKKIVISKFADADVTIEDMVGDGNHLHLTISSPDFKGKGMLEQHRMVYSALEGKVGNEIHALKLTTTVKGEVYEGQ